LREAARQQEVRSSAPRSCHVHEWWWWWFCCCCAMAAVANDQKGKHDAVLDFLVDKHGHDGERVMDTVVDLLHRRGLLSTDEFGVGPSGTRALTERRHVDVFRRYCAGALDPQPGAGVAREERAEALAAAAPAAPPPAPAVLSPDLLALPVSVTPSAAKALEKALAEAAAKASAASTGGAAEEIKGGTPCKRSGCDLTYGAIQPPLPPLVASSIAPRVSPCQKRQWPCLGRRRCPLACVGMG
jgi:hypothetical protein